VHGVNVLSEEVATLVSMVYVVRLEPGTQDSLQLKSDGTITGEICYKKLTTASFCSYSTPVHCPIRVLVLVNTFCLSVKARLICYSIMCPWRR
jgi:hypothetical protein